MAQGHELAITMFELQSDIALKYGVHLGERTVQLVGEIDQSMFILIDTALTMLEAQSKAQITVKINSEGGSVYDALAIVGRMRSSKCKIVTEGFGAIMSAAALILAAGNKRKISRYSTFMHHEASMGVEGTLKQIEHVTKQALKESEIWCTYMAEFSSKDKDFWLNEGVLGQDLYLTAEECLEHGVVDEII